MLEPAPLIVILEQKRRYTSRAAVSAERHIDNLGAVGMGAYTGEEVLGLDA